MTEDSKVHDNSSQRRSPIAELTRKVLLAGIGAAVLAQEEAESFIQKLVEKGELAEKEGKGILKDFHEKRWEKKGNEIDRVVASIVQRMDIPTRSDFQKLSEKISEISKKVNDLEVK
jgi:polyhydroxyalkanoate synthesis regulator phasin